MVAGNASNACMPHVRKHVSMELRTSSSPCARMDRSCSFACRSTAFTLNGGISDAKIHP
jgi:hypothetical protein